MKLYHGSEKTGLKHLLIGEATKKGRGVYLTDSLEQAKYFGRYGSVYTVEVEEALTLDYSDEELMNDLFSELLSNPFVCYEIECLANGSGNFSTLLNYANDSIKEELKKYKIHKIKSLGFKGHFNYIVKDESLVSIINEEMI